jgi:hypothetical protein
MVPIFNQGKWLHVKLPVPLDRAWTKDHQLLYAAVYQRLIQRGISHELGTQVAEAYVYREVSPGLKFTRELQALLEIA